MTMRILTAPLPRQRAHRLAAIIEETGWPVVQSVSAFELNERDDTWRVEILCAPRHLPPAATWGQTRLDEALLSWLNALIASAMPENPGAAPAPGFHLAQLPQIDWVKKVQQGLSPVRAGRFFIHGAHDRQARPPNTVNIEIEAGLAFGTGHHGTTKGCLLALDWLMKTRTLHPGRGGTTTGGHGARVLDVGTGSGVLAIAAARTHLQGPLLAGDIDPVAVRTAAANARRNGAPAIRFYTAPGTRHPLPIRLAAPLPRRTRPRATRPGLARVGAALAASHLPQAPCSRWRALKRRRATPFSHGGFDLVFANILSRPLVRLAPELTNTLAPGGHLVLSGLLAEHEALVLGAYLPRGLKLLRRWRLEGWSTLLLRRQHRRED